MMEWIKQTLFPYVNDFSTNSTFEGATYWVKVYEMLLTQEFETMIGKAEDILQVDWKWSMDG